MALWLDTVCHGFDYAILSAIHAFALAAGDVAMAPHTSTLAWKISWMEKPGRLQSMGTLRVGHD